eukprot:gene25764-biopygen15059
MAYNTQKRSVERRQGAAGACWRRGVGELQTGHPAGYADIMLASTKVHHDSGVIKSKCSRNTSCSHMAALAAPLCPHFPYVLPEAAPAAPHHPPPPHTHTRILGGLERRLRRRNPLILFPWVGPGPGRWPVPKKSRF